METTLQHVPSSLLPEAAGLAYGARYAHRFMKPGVMGVIDPFGMARDEAKVGMRRFELLADKLAYERGFKTGFADTFNAIPGAK